MRRMLFLLLSLNLLFSIAASGQQLEAVVKDFSGKVEVKQTGQDWQPVQLNMVVPQGAMVSTGFASRLTLALGPTQIAVRPLTRMLLRELIKQGSTDVTRLTLRVGKVNVSVKAASGEKNDFSIRGPAATAAVRGTEFNFDVNIEDEVEGLDGYTYLVSNATGQETSVGPGMFGAVNDVGRFRLSDQIIIQHSSSGWIPNDLLWWATEHESALTLSTNTNNLIAPSVQSSVVGATGATTPGIITVTVN